MSRGKGFLLGVKMGQNIGSREGVCRDKHYPVLGRGVFFGSSSFVSWVPISFWGVFICLSRGGYRNALAQGQAAQYHLRSIPRRRLRA